MYGIEAMSRKLPLEGGDARAGVSAGLTVKSLAVGTLGAAFVAFASTAALAKPGVRLGGGTLSITVLLTFTIVVLGLNVALKAILELLLEVSYEDRVPRWTLKFPPEEFR